MFDWTALFSATALFYIVFGTFLGIIVGALPGLTATMAVALLVSLTYGLSPVNAIVVLVSVYLGGIYGGSRAAILLNVPGTPSSAATALDGFPLTRRGEGAKAGIIVTTFSALGGILGLIILILASPFLANFALKFGVWEYFWMAIFGIFMSSNLTSSRIYKGLIAGFMGMLISCVGLDPIHGFGRYTFGQTSLMGGISLVPAMIGLFGLAEAFEAIRNPLSHSREDSEQEQVPLFQLFVSSLKMLFKKPILFLRSGIVGTLIGALPGVGPDIASWVSYGLAKRSSKEKDKFGQGSYEGVIASETANNAATSGVFIPLLTLGIPGCAVSAVILGGIQLHGFRPGPTFFFENLSFIYFIVGVLFLTNIIMLIEGTFLTKIISKVLKVNIGIIMPVVIVLSVIGAYAVNLRNFNVGVMLVFGFLGIIMRQLKIPAAPMALGIILGPMADLSFRRGLLAKSYSVLPFFTRPISLVLILTIFMVTIGPNLLKLFRKIRLKRS
ncbi:MAG: tripartite tricarboxylate transporter permease [Halanaerobiales bacterium]|nr:tripartite tricarboxylate transporter permease [Halanaerobiales bacterium]